MNKHGSPNKFCSYVTRDEDHSKYIYNTILKDTLLQPQQQHQPHKCQKPNNYKQRLHNVWLRRHQLNLLLHFPQLAHENLENLPV
jgi:hypothetical protein